MSANEESSESGLDEESWEDEEEESASDAFETVSEHTASQD